MRSFICLFFVVLLTAELLAQRNVGINTNPAFAYTLHVHDSTRSDVSIGLTNNVSSTDGTSGLRLRLSNNNFILSNDATNGDIKITTGFNTRMTIKANGNIGINNADPSEKLEVDGNIRFKGLLMPNGDAGLQGQALFSNGSLFPQWRTVNSNPQIGFRAAANIPQRLDLDVPYEVKFWGVDFNDGGGYDSLSRFVCPESGRYKIDANITFYVSGDSSFRCGAYLHTGGVLGFYYSDKIIDYYNSAFAHSFFRPAKLRFSFVVKFQVYV